MAQTRCGSLHGMFQVKGPLVLHAQQTAQVPHVDIRDLPEQPRHLALGNLRQPSQSGHPGEIGHQVIPNVLCFDKCHTGHPVHLWHYGQQFASARPDLQTEKGRPEWQV